jgi:2-polyprenyl-3-methyl-5-hydroxy-6-metoxy-1,4-benzoquinol methylase
VSQENQQICDICGGSSFIVISRHDRHGKPMTTGICEGCGLVSHMPVPSEEEIAAYYANDYRRDYHGERTPSPRRIMRAWNNGQRIVGLIEKHLPEGADVFEIGAGIGCTVKSFETHGFTAGGIEPNRDFNSYTHKVLHADVANCNLYDLEGTQSHDVLLLIHVIEHFTSPTTALMHIREQLKDGGLLHIECPNIAAPFATFGRLFHFAHIYNFTPATLIALAKKCGFAMVENFADGDSDPDIKILFRKVDIPAEFTADADEAARVKAAIYRYNTLTYHLRGDYLARRMKKLASYGREYLTAGSFVRDLEARFNP